MYGLKPVPFSDTKSEVEREFCKRLEMPEKSKPTSGSRFVGVDC
jgi:hypothetical protein